MLENLTNRDIFLTVIILVATIVSLVYEYFNAPTME